MSTISRESLLDDAVAWLSTRADRAIAARYASQARSSSQREHQSYTERAARKIPVVRRLVDEPPTTPRYEEYPRVGRSIARSSARGRVEFPVAEIDEGLDACSVAGAICAAWREPRARSLAVAWLSDEDFDEEVVMNMDAKTIAILVGVAAAAAVLAVVWVLRRGRSVRLPARTDISPSDDFVSLRRVADARGQGAEVASRLIADAKEPWNWSLAPELSSLSAQEKHRLLAGFVAIGASDVQVVRPKAGEAFNARTMRPVARITDDDCWVVAGEPSDDHVGFAIAGRVVVTAQVDVCTADWWVLSQRDCPVGRAVADGADDLIAGGRDGAAGWRAPWGLTHPEDLRGRLGFDEPTLEAWRARMASGIKKYYVKRPDRCLAITGMVGEGFETSTMEDPHGPPVGDAVVVDVVLRDGIPQHGLACPGGSPLLLAVVSTKPVDQAAT